MALDTVHRIEAIFDKFAQTTYDVVVWDLQIAKANPQYGLEVLEILAMDSPRTQIIVATSSDTLSLALACLKAGAFHYLHTPVKGQELQALIDVAVQKQPAFGENKLLARSSHTLSRRFGQLLGGSASMQTVYARIQEAAATEVTVLITGETGTGKDLVAVAIHEHSARHHGPYLAVNTGAMAPELVASELFGHEKGAFTSAEGQKPGQFEQANGGTIFLDEISTMDAKTQVSLLRLLETRTLRRLGGRKAITVDVRLMAATNERLETAVARGTFRQDLYYRFDVFRIDLPPLRERHGDIMLLARDFVARYNTLYNKAVDDFAPEAIHVLERYPWPGNVRELKNTIQRAVLMARNTVLTAELLPNRIRNGQDDAMTAAPLPLPLGMTLRMVEREYIVHTLAASGGNKQRAAQALGISRRALYNKLERYELL